MKISFDFDGTLTERVIKELVSKLIESGTDVYILTSRFSDCMKDCYELAERLKIRSENVLSTNLQDKGDYILANNLDLDMHFDDDYFEIDSINAKTKTLGVLISLDMHPINQDNKQNELL